MGISACDSTVPTASKDRLFNIIGQDAFLKVYRGSYSGETWRAPGIEFMSDTTGAFTNTSYQYQWDIYCNPPDGNFNFRNRKPAVSVDFLSLKSNGNVGISNTNPQYKLDVNGTLNVVSATTLNNNLTVSGSTNCNSNLSIAGNTTMNSGLTVQGGDLILNNNLGVYGTNGIFIWNGVGGANTISLKPNGTITTTGTITATGSITSSSSISATGPIISSSKIYALGLSLDSGTLYRTYFINNGAVVNINPHMVTDHILISSKLKPASGSERWYYLFYNTNLTTGWDISRSGFGILRWYNAGTPIFSYMQISAATPNAVLEFFDPVNGYINFYHYWTQSVQLGCIWLLPFDNYN